MSVSGSAHRLWSVDLARGLLISLMVLGHTIYFFHSGTYPLLQNLNGLADALCFSGLIFLSGITAHLAYLHLDHPHPDMIRRVLKRLFIYLLGYYLLSLIGLFFKGQLNLSTVRLVLTFQLFAPFTEFIPVFIAYGLIKIPFKPLLYRLSRSLPATLAVGFGAYLLSVWLYRLPLPPSYRPFQALLAGSAGYYTFPVLAYLPLFLIGIWVGAKLYRAPEKLVGRTLLQLAAITSLIGLGLGLVLPLLAVPPELSWHRFPPSPLFLVTGLAVCLWLLVFLIRFRHLKHLPWTQAFLLLVGANAYAVYWSHTLLLLVASGLGAPPVASFILTLLIALGSLAVSLYLAKILPLNYRYGLTVYDLIEDFCLTPAEENRLLSLTHRLLLQLTNLPRLFTIPVGSRRIRLISGRTMLVTGFLLFLLASEVGVAEEILVNRQQWQNLKGQVDRSWLVPGLTSLTYSLSLPDTFTFNRDQLRVFLLVDGQTRQAMTPKDHVFSTSLAADSLSYGPHELSAGISLSGQTLTSRPVTIQVSAPLYVSWTVDWEGYDVPDAYLTAMDRISHQFGLPVTHMFNPRIYTDPDIDPLRAETLTRYIQGRLAQGDDLGLHLHLFPDLVQAAGLPYHADQIWGGGFTEGYDVLTTAYSTTDMTRLLRFSQDLFTQHGLPLPLTFRAGAWFANLDTLQALEAAGFVADSSARTAYSFGTNSVSGFWDVAPDRLPYYPSVYNQNQSGPPPNLKVLEIPNNGADDYAFSAPDMIDRFYQNFSGQPLLSPRQVTYLSHPQWLTAGRQLQMRQVFSELQRHSALSGNGPLVFATLTQIYEAFK